MKNCNGFSLIEVLVAFGIVVMLIVTVFPISIQISKEQMKLSQQLTNAGVLYDELQQKILTPSTSMPLAYDKKIQNSLLSFQFTKTNGLIKGCVKWTNVKKQKEEICLFGYPD